MYMYFFNLIYVVNVIELEKMNIYVRLFFIGKKVLIVFVDLF